MKARVYFYAIERAFDFKDIAAVEVDTGNGNYNIIFTMENGTNEVIDLDKCSVRMLVE